MKKQPKALELKAEIDQGLHLPFSHWKPKATCTALVGSRGDEAITHNGALKVPNASVLPPKHMNLQDANFQRCKYGFPRPIMYISSAVWCTFQEHTSSRIVLCVLYCRVPCSLGFPSSSVVKNLPANAGDVGSIPGSGRFPGKGNGNPL